MDLANLGIKQNVDITKKLDQLKADPKNPGNNQRAIDYVIGLEIQKTVATFDEYIMYFDAVDDEKKEGTKDDCPTKEKIKREDTALFQPDEWFAPSKAITGLERMRGVLIFRIKNM